MANTVRQYLAEVEEKLVHTMDDFTLQAVLAETESHLKESVEEIQSMGFTRMEAESRAVATFGQPEQFGVAIKEANPDHVAVPPSAMIWTATIATTAIVLWPLLVHQFPYYHPDETLVAMRRAFQPALLVGLAALLGSRVRARSLFLVALVGGILLVPVLAWRCVGSGNYGGIVVRSLALREDVANQPASSTEYASRYRRARDEIYKNQAIVNAGKLPTAKSRSGDIHYLAPPLIVPQAIWGDPPGVVEYNTAQNARKAWQKFAALAIQRDDDGIETYSRMAAEAQSRLDETYLVRLRSMASWALLMAFVWGTVMTFMQFAGTTVRRATQAIYRLLPKPTGWKTGAQ